MSYKSRRMLRRTKTGLLTLLGRSSKRTSELIASDWFLGFPLAFICFRFAQNSHALGPLNSNKTMLGSLRPVESERPNDWGRQETCRCQGTWSAAFARFRFPLPVPNASRPSSRCGRCPRQRSLLWFVFWQKAPLTHS